ncbi:MAG TPA: SusC/RagA family TonB-linked outer membrane protein [Flavobacteriales bacterium]|nr:SusC/RagA family TonB-linked outer membrane protein [Flavobacteriales bacterium]
MARPILLLLLIAISLYSNAQEITLVGKVTDKAEGLGLPGATVLVRGTTKGTTTDIDGKFSIAVLPTDSIQVRYIGFTEQIIPVDNRKEIAITLEPAATQLGEVVVTALGIPREEKSLGYAVGKMDVRSATVTRDPNVVNSMQGKIAGVQITKTSGGPGASSRILIRGNSSVVNNNQPLVVVDGIPIDNTTQGSGGTWGGIDFGSPISDIDPDDIESLIVLKGPSAAALYGSRALNGVIVITTKSAGSKKGWRVGVNSNTSIESAYILTKLQNTYGAGSEGKFKYTPEGIPFFETDRPSLPTYAASWGPEMLGQQYIDWNGDTTTFSPQPNNYKKYFQLGHTLTNSISLAHGGKFPVRISFTDLRNQGITPTSTFKRNNLNLTNSGAITKKLEYALKFTYVDQRAYNRVNQSNGHNAARNIIMMPRNVSTESMENFEDSDGREQVWYTNWGWIGNPFFTVERNINRDDRKRYLGNVSLIHKTKDWLSVMGRIGMDHFDEDRHNRIASRSFTSPNGEFNDDKLNFLEVNADYLISAKKKIKEIWEISGNLGGNAMYQKRSTRSQSGRNLIVPFEYNLENVAPSNRTDRTFLYERRINSIYGSAQVSYMSYLFLDLTGRNDWTSTLPKQNNSYFYPSASLSYLFSEHMAKRPKFLTYGKLRASIAQVGKDADPYQLALAYDSLTSVDGVAISRVHNPFPLVNLKPEKKRSYEFGVELRMFKDRVSVDFTYYNASTFNQILTSSVSAASGYTTAVVNAGEIRNRGVEILFNTAPIVAKNFRWTNMINFTKNNNLVVSLNSSGQQEILGDQWRVNITATPGLPYGSIFGYGIQRDGNGSTLMNADGTYVRTAQQVLLGDVNPDWRLGITNGFEYKNWVFSFLVDIQKGGDIYSATNMYMHGYSGNAVATLEGRKEWYASEAARVAAGVADNGSEPNGNYVINWEPTGGYTVSGVYAPGTVVNGQDVGGQAVERTIDPQVYWTQYAVWGKEIHEPFVYDASYVKLREAGLTYRFGKNAFGKKLRNVELTISGRNLWLIHSNVPNIDPEASYSNGNGQGVEYATYPITRSIGFNIKAEF